MRGSCSRTDCADAEHADAPAQFDVSAPPAPPAPPSASSASAASHEERLKESLRNKEAENRLKTEGAGAA